VVPVVIDLPSGKKLTVRKMAEEDVPGLDALYSALSVEDTYRRFFSAFGERGFGAKWYARTRDNGFAVVAVLEDGLAEARVVADGGYVLLANGDAEFGLTVARDWRGWLGPYLLDVLVAVAASKGIPNLEADILTENRPMQTLARRRGVVTMGAGDDFSVVRVALPAASPDRPSWPATPGHHRLLVEAQGARWAHAADAMRAGFEVLTCGGPDARCPALQGRVCPLADGADVIVIARPPSDARTQSLVTAHARLHPSVPVIVQGQAGEAGDCSLHAGSTGAQVAAALRQAVGDAPPPEP